MLDPRNSLDDSNRLRAASNFLGILNDIKRRPEDAARELDVSLELINSIIEGDIDLPQNLIEKAIKIWPINKRDFFIIEDDCSHGIKIMLSKDSEKTSRIMYRARKPYCLLYTSPSPRDGLLSRMPSSA